MNGSGQLLGRSRASFSTLRVVPATADDAVAIRDRVSLAPAPIVADIVVSAFNGASDFPHRAIEF